MKRKASIFAIAIWLGWAPAGVKGQDSLMRRNRMQGIAELGPAEFHVHGVNGSSATLTAADLYKMPQQNISVNDRGTPVTYQGVLLTDVLAKVSTPSGEAFMKTGASHYVVVEGQDGYKAVFSWAEIDTSFTDRKLYIAMKRDGLPIAQKHGPFHLIVPGDKRNSRWVRQVKHIRIEALPVRGG